MDIFKYQTIEYNGYNIYLPDQVYFLVFAQ